MSISYILSIVYLVVSFLIYKKNNINEVQDLWVPKQWAIPIIGEEEYNNLVQLTKELGGYINEDATMIDISKQEQ